MLLSFPVSFRFWRNPCTAADTSPLEKGRIRSSKSRNTDSSWAGSRPMIEALSRARKTEAKAALNDPRDHRGLWRSTAAWYRGRYPLSDEHFGPSPMDRTHPIQEGKSKEGPQSRQAASGCATPRRDVHPLPPRDNLFCILILPFSIPLGGETASISALPSASRV